MTAPVDKGSYIIMEGVGAALQWLQSAYQSPNASLVLHSVTPNPHRWTHGHHGLKGHRPNTTGTPTWLPYNELAQPWYSEANATLPFSSSDNTTRTPDPLVTALDYELGLAQTWTFASIITLIFTAVILIITVVGNVCVVAAVQQSKALQAPQNKLIVSLALADLLVGLVVMPFAAITDFAGKWILGATPCDIYAVLDVCLCTSSILHLVAIAVDRYFSITNMRYIQGRNVNMMYCAIALIWILSLLLSVGPVLGWRDDNYAGRILLGECLISQDVSFQIFATTVAFYGPLVGILVLYGLIFQRTRSRVRKRIETTLQSTLHEIGKIEKDVASSYPLQSGPGTPASTPSTPVHVSTFHNGTWTSRLKFPRRKRSPGVSPRISRKRRLPSLVGSTDNMNLSTPKQRSRGNSSTQTTHSDEPDSPPASTAPLRTYSDSNGQPLLVSSANDLVPAKETPNRLAKKTSSNLSARHQLLLRREKKAATTLAIITLSFIACWLPFFVWAVIRPTCGGCSIGHTWEAVFLWLGYVNSTLNPLIYTVFSPDFRAAFKKMFGLDKR